MNLKYFYLSIVFITSFCFANNLYYLHESTDIIRTLIEDKQLNVIFDDVEPGALVILINNYSPAAIALEAEAFNCTLPVILYFYHTNDTNHQETITLFEQHAFSYDNRIKYIAIDIEKLPAIVQKFEIQSTPAVSVLHQWQEIEFVSSKITHDILYTLAEKLLQIHHNS